MPIWPEFTGRLSASKTSGPD